MIKKIIMSTILSISTLVALPEGYSIELFVSDLKPYLPFIAEQRINVYREYPYLYEGKLIEEIEYLEWFSRLKDSAVVIAFYNDEPVGFIAATALTAFDEHFKGSCDLFRAAGLPYQNYYYFSDAIVMPEHRHKSLLTHMAQAIEEHAQILGYTAGCFVCESHQKHVLKPNDYKELDSIFKKQGYTKTDMIISYYWATRLADGSSEIQTHAMNYWIKDFTQ